MQVPFRREKFRGPSEAGMESGRPLRPRFHHHVDQAPLALA